MSNLSEIDIQKAFICQSICMASLSKCAKRNRATANGDEYIVYSCGFLYDQELRELFGVTDKLKDLWERRGTEFNVHLIVSDGTITACEINKYREGDGARPGYSSLKCTPQELRIAQRILNYITQEN